MPLTIEGLIAVLALCVGAFSLGYMISIWYCHIGQNSKIQK